MKLFKKSKDTIRSVSGMLNDRVPKPAILAGKRRYVVAGVLALLVIIAVSSIFQYYRWRTLRKTDDTGEIQTENVGIQMFTVERKDMIDELTILGQIVFLEKINISSKVTGRLERITVAEGTRVSKGQFLAGIEKLPLQLTLTQQQAELEIAKRSYDLSKAKYENAIKAIETKLKTIEKAEADLEDKKVSYKNTDRMLKNKIELFKAGGVSESDLASLKANHKTMYTKYLLAKSDLDIQKVGFRDQDLISEGLPVPKNAKEKYELFQRINTKIERAELEAAKSKITQVEKSIESTRILLSETDIRSPITGIVAAKSMEAGEMVKQESVLLTLVNISRVFVAMNINEKDIRRIKSDQEVHFTVDALGDEKFKGRISRINPVLDVKTRTVEVKAALENPGMRLLPGMFARANINCGNLKDIIAIPVSALLRKDTTTGELYVVKQGIVFKQAVELGRELKSDIEITKGLSDGDVIVIKGLNLLYPGAKIRTDEKKTASPAEVR